MQNAITRGYNVGLQVAVADPGFEKRGGADVRPLHPPPLDPRLSRAN